MPGPLDGSREAANVDRMVRDRHRGGFQMRTCSRMPPALTTRNTLPFGPHQFRQASARAQGFQGAISARTRLTKGFPRIPRTRAPLRRRIETRSVTLTTQAGNPSLSTPAPINTFAGFGQ
jgi:hypothetical protein